MATYAGVLILIGIFIIPERVAFLITIVLLAASFVFPPALEFAAIFGVIAIARHVLPI